VGFAGWGVAWINPGIRNDAGETLGEAVKLPQPAINRQKPAEAAKRSNLTFEVTQKAV
jgi:hypothetical protein